MEAFFFYIIKSTLCLVLFYIFFRSLLSKETFFRFNRFVLIGGISICAILPFIVLKNQKETAIQTPIRQIENFIVPYKDTGLKDKAANLPIFVTTTNEKSDSPVIEKPVKYKTTFSLSQTQILLLIYVIGLVICLSGFIISLFKMLQLMRKGKKIKEDKYIIVLVNQKICPFSFGKYIVLSETDYQQNPKEILTHELIHTRKKHSLDLLYTEFFVLLHWFNPAIWLLKRELQDVHEYEADNGVINQGIDATKYQLLLVKKAVGARSYTVANSFNHSKIKNRITMMLKRKSTQWARLKLILFVPLAAVVLQAFARPEMTGIKETLLNSEVTTIFDNPQKWTKNYFDEEVDSYLKRVNNKTNDSQDWDCIGIQLTGQSSMIALPSKEGSDAKKLSCVYKSFKENDSGKFLDTLKIVIKSAEEKRMKKNRYSPSLVFLQIEKGTPESKVQAVLDALGNLRIEITKAREEQKKKEWEKNINTEFIELLPVPFFVAINERMKPFGSDKYLLKETVKMTELKVVRDSTKTKSTTTPPPPIPKTK